MREFLSRDAKRLLLVQVNVEIERGSDPKTLRAEIIKWVAETQIRDSGSQANSADVQVESGLSPSDASLLHRNKRAGGIYKRVSILCGVSCDTLRRFCEEKTQLQTKTRMLIVDAWKRHLGFDDAPNPRSFPFIFAPTPAQKRDVREEAEKLAHRVAENSQLGGKHALRSVLEIIEESDALQRKALGVGDHEVATAITITQGCALIKSGSTACECDQSWRIYETLRWGAKPTRGLQDAANMTCSRLLREFIPRFASATDRLNKHKEAAELMASINGEALLTLKTMLPGLASETNRGERINTNADPLVDFVPRPFRYQAYNYLTAGLQSFLIQPNNVDQFKDWIKKAASSALDGHRENRAKPLGIYLQSVEKEIQCIRLIVPALASKENHSDSDPFKNAVTGISDFYENVASDKNLSAYDKQHYEATALTGKYLLEFPRLEQRRTRLYDDVIPRIQGCVEKRPTTRLMLTQESLFHIALLRDHQLRPHFLKACGFTEETIANYRHLWGSSDASSPSRAPLR